MTDRGQQSQLDSQRDSTSTPAKGDISPKPPRRRVFSTCSGSVTAPEAPAIERHFSKLESRLEALLALVVDIKSKSDHESAAIGQIMGVLEGKPDGRSNPQRSDEIEEVTMCRAQGQGATPDASFNGRDSVRNGNAQPSGGGGGGGGGSSGGSSGGVRRSGREPWADEDSILSIDPDVKQLLHSDKALRSLLERLKNQRQLADSRKQQLTLLDHWVISPEHPFRSKWNVVLVILLIYTCAVVPLRIAFDSMFDSGKTFFDGFDIFIEW